MVDRLAYIFPGQGAQYVGMGKDLYDAFPQAKEIFDKADRILGFGLTKLCFEGPREELSRTSISQPAILTVSIASLRAMQKILPGITASFTLGLSLGEYSALVFAGSLEFIEALKLVYSRGRFMEEASKKNPGKMACLIGLDLKAAEEICKETGSEIANLNCPGQIVISARNQVMEKVGALAKEKGAKKVIILDVSGPFHSSLMNEASGKLAGVLSKVKLTPPSIPVISNVDAQEESTEEKIKENLINQVNHRTHWKDSIKKVRDSGVRTYIEIGPGKVLKGLLRRIDSSLTVHSAGEVKEIEELKDVIKG